MDQAELLRYMVETLESLGIDYMVSGSQASIYYGEPRMTQDIDVIAEVTPAHLPGLLERFASPQFYGPTAKALGLTIPQSILIRVDEVLQ